jgi:hypothetical protein
VVSESEAWRLGGEATQLEDRHQPDPTRLSGSRHHSTRSDSRKWKLACSFEPSWSWFAWKSDEVVAGRMNSTRIACILNKDNRRSYMAREVYVSTPHEVKTIGIYAGMDCCCSAGSIAISNEAPLWSDIGRGISFRLRTIRGRLRGRLGGRLFRLHRHRVLWRQVRDVSVFEA